MGRGWLRKPEKGLARRGICAAYCNAYLVCGKRGNKGMGVVHYIIKQIHIKCFTQNEEGDKIE